MLADGLSEPANPPTPKNRNFPFQGLGICNWNVADPSGAPKPVVFTVPSTLQNSGLPAPAGTSTAATMVTLGTAKPAIVAALQLGSTAAAGDALIVRPASTRPATCEVQFARMIVPPRMHPARELSSKFRRRAMVETTRRWRKAR